MSSRSGGRGRKNSGGSSRPPVPQPRWNTRSKSQSRSQPYPSPQSRPPVHNSGIEPSPSETSSESSSRSLVPALPPTALSLASAAATAPTYPAPTSSQSNQVPRSTPVIDQVAFNLTPSQAATTTYAGSTMGDRENDDAQSRISTFTLNSENASRYVQSVAGRNFNTLNEIYFLPTDEDEWTRLNKQHVAFVIGLGRLYPTKEVEKLLAPVDGETKRVLDLGCGSGVWATEMAREFPHTSVVGVDLAPVPINQSSLPSNCNFEIDDINFGLPHFHGQFDLVHARLIGAGIKDFRQTVHEAIVCLKPGGMVIWSEPDYDFYSASAMGQRRGETSDRTGMMWSRIASEQYPNGSWFGRIIWEMKRSSVNLGRSDMIEMAKAIDEGLWNHELIDPDTCKSASLHLPLGPWAHSNDFEQTQLLKYTGSLMRLDAMNVHRAIQPLLQKAGWPAATVSQWSTNADTELMTLEKPLWARFGYFWGRKRAGPGQPAPELGSSQPSTPTGTTVATSQSTTLSASLPISLPTSSNNGNNGGNGNGNGSGNGSPPGTNSKAFTHSNTKYPHFYVFDTLEASLREAAFRNRGKDVPPPAPAPNPPPPPPPAPDADADADADITEDPISQDG